ncbi:V-type ATP synthase subunit B [Desulfurococcus amylolyticus]|uniref:A-type ATP synthase subunit B n=1 Tax=Desulfurococcus amylolyticus DSM 16532 TaxID=768672 RepID=I3XSR4_DESAM|nr:V-type ATP synthase subunit B [Desulfurococcus amylolyticus]AFL66988.1 H+transporting two-sector ATPase alpha/beta subunit central region [Desulfurococcus amylolyticus DSM 16532]
MSVKLTTRISSKLLKAQGGLLFAETIPGVTYGEIVEVTLPTGEVKLGQVIDVSKEVTVIQVFGGVADVDLSRSRVKYRGETLKIPVSIDMLGRIFDGLGRPIDGGPRIIPEDYLDINGAPLNPASRLPPSEFIETGISAIDGLFSIVRGQKLPIFSGSGLPHNRIAAQIVRQARVLGKEEKFAIVFAAIGVPYDDAMFFIDNFKKTGALERTVALINTASSPVIERIATPRVALTIAEHLAWTHDMHVLVILTDMTFYCEALRELSAAREEVPGRRGYPGYMYTDLATIYERAGRVHSKKGSITQLPILTMPDDDITHPIPDLTGYITEGQLVLSRQLWMKGIYPPFDPLMSLSRLMKDGIGEGKTREDHSNVFMQLISAYAEGIRLRELSVIVGTETLTQRDRKYLEFADRFEREFIGQGEYERRKIEETLDKGWELLAILPEEELKKIKIEYIRKYHPKYKGGNP